MQAHPVAEIFPIMSDSETADLAADIREHGLREPIWIDHTGRVIDGRNRWRACEMAGVEPTTRVYEGEERDLVAFVVSLNLKRRHLDESQRSMVAAKIANLSHGQRADTQICGTAVTQPVAAELLNVSTRAVQHATKVQQHGAPELVAAVERGEVKVSVAADVATKPKEEQREIVARGEREILEAAKKIRAERAEVRREERIENIARISEGNAPLLTPRRYPIIYADPPWRYENPPMGGTNRSIENHYPTLDLGEICALPVADIAADDCLLYLWATAPKLAECFQVIDAWGFEYRTCMVWVKDKIGMGYHARNRHELLLICKRGAIPPPSVEDRPDSVVEAARGKHSEKPDEFYEIIERAYPTLAKIELFARETREGWAAWGNQARAA